MRSCRVRMSPLLNAALGAAVWLAAVSWNQPSPWQTSWAIALLLFAVLVLVPLGLQVAQAASSLILVLHLPAALLLGVSFLLDQGWLAAALALPWLIVTGWIACEAGHRVRRRGLAPLSDLCVDVGCIFLVVGGGWAVLHRAGIRPLGFDDVIVLLTAIHFHYAGLVLPILTGRVGRLLAGKIATAACLGVLAGVPLTAAGISATQLGWGSALEVGAACLTAAAGALTALLCLRLALTPHARRLACGLGVRGLWAMAGGALLFSMVLAALYGLRTVIEVSWLDIPWMRVLHGTANAFGFAAAGLCAWCWSERTVLPARISCTASPSSTGKKAEKAPPEASPGSARLE
jgi:YndJ-like protein